MGSIKCINAWSLSGMAAGGDHDSVTTLEKNLEMEIVNNDHHPQKTFGKIKLSVKIDWDVSTTGSDVKNLREQYEVQKATLLVVN